MNTYNMNVSILMWILFSV